MAKFTNLFIIISFLLVIICLVNISSSSTDESTVPKTGDYTLEKNYTCFSDTDCNGHGRCYSNKTGCECYPDWATYGDASDNSTHCAYKRRSERVAFLLSLFVGGFGIDWFYLSRTGSHYIIAGILKLVLVCGCCSVWFLAYMRHEIQSLPLLKPRSYAFCLYVSLCVFVWWIVDWARILGNRFPDGRGVALTPW